MTEDYGDLIESTASRSAVGLIDTDSGSPELIGSGTLVRYGHISGVLTCAHVLERVMPQKQIGIVSFPVRQGAYQPYKINSGLVVSWKFGPSNTEYGPDIGFLRLPDSFMADLAAKASIVDLAEHAKRRDVVPPDAKPFYLVAGAIGEWSTEATHSKSKITKHIQGLANVGKVIARNDLLPYDLLTFKPVPQQEQPFALPQSYGGTSGGGLWRYYVREAGHPSGPLEIWALTGVAFWETEADESGRQIICHGPRSIYENVLSELTTKWPD